jgi:hypothetical protein
MLNFLVKTVGLLLIGLGVIFLLDKKKFYSFIGFFGKKNNIYIAGVIKVILGILFLSVASNANIFLSILGVLSFLSAAVIFILGPRKLNNYINIWADKSGQNVSWIAICYIAIGVLLIYLI